MYICHRQRTRIFKYARRRKIRKTHLCEHTHPHTKQACILAQGLLSAQVFAHLGSAAGMSGMPVLSRSLFLPDRSFLPLHWVSFNTFSLHVTSQQPVGAQEVSAEDMCLFAFVAEYVNVCFGLS